MKYYSREILEQYLKNTRLNRVLDIIDEIEQDINENKTVPATIELYFCNNCKHRYTFNCPMYDEEIDPFSGEAFVIADTTDNGFCYVGEEK